jgi:hypothetical protein
MMENVKTGNLYAVSQNQGFWEILRHGRWHDDECKKAHLCVNARHLSYYAIVYDIAFGLCMSLRNKKKEKKARERYISSICQVTTVGRLQLLLAQSEVSAT